MKPPKSLTSEEKWYCSKHSLNHGQKYKSCHPAKPIPEQAGWERDLEGRFEDSNTKKYYPFIHPKVIKELKDFFRKELKRARQEGIEEGLNKIDSFDLVEPCNPECTPEEHAYHEGTWDSHLKLEKIIYRLKEKLAL